MHGADENPLIEWARQREQGFTKQAAKEANLRERVLQELTGRLWHTTHPDRFSKILSTGAILPDPPCLSNSERWGALADNDHLPYVRYLGGISLFDFDQFDRETYSARNPSSSWAYFVPYHSSWECAVWIELNRSDFVPPQFISGSELLAKWKADQAYGHNFMPEIEAAYLGAIPIKVFKRAFEVRKGNGEIRELAFQ
jgi:hypothetical protein